MPFGLGFGETILIFAVVLLFFGPRRLPEAAASLGKGIREFKRAVSGVGEELMSPANTIATPPPAAPAHATLAGTGADPLAVPSTAAPVVAEPLGEAAASPSSEAPVG